VAVWAEQVGPVFQAVEPVALAWAEQAADSHLARGLVHY